jgi:type IV pilus assembly protein PilM
MFLLNHTFSGFGLDIDDSAIKIVQLKKSRTFSGKSFFMLEGYGKTELPKGIVENGEIKDTAQLAEFISQLISETRPKKIKSRSAVASLPEKKSFLKLFEIKAKNDAETENEIKKNINRDFPLSDDELYIDTQIISKKRDGENFKYRILVGAIQKNYADSLTETFKISNIIPVAFETEGIATARSVFKLEPTIFDAPISNQAIIDIGSTTSNIIFMQKEAPAFSLSLPISGNSMTKSIASSLKISEAKAEKLKMECGLDAKLCDGKLQTALSALIKDISQKIENAIAFYNKSFPKNKITKISLSGGGAKLLNLDDALSQNLKIKIRKCDPLTNIKTNDVEFQKDAMQYATAIGLAVRALILPYP